MTNQVLFQQTDNFFLISTRLTLFPFPPPPFVTYASTKYFFNALVLNYLLYPEKHLYVKHLTLIISQFLKQNKKKLKLEFACFYYLVLNLTLKPIITHQILSQMQERSSGLFWIKFHGIWIQWQCCWKWTVCHSQIPSYPRSWRKYRIFNMSFMMGVSEWLLFNANSTIV